MNIRRFLQYRLKSLFMVIVVVAIVLAYGTRFLQKQREVRLQRDSFAALQGKAASWHFKMRKEIELNKGLDFDSSGSGDNLALDFQNPHFLYRSSFRSRSEVNPEWKAELSIRSKMGDYPANHLLLIEYPTGVENRKFAEMAEAYFADDKVTTRLIETPEAID